MRGFEIYQQMPALEARSASSSRGLPLDFGPSALVRILFRLGHIVPTGSVRVVALDVSRREHHRVEPTRDHARGCARQRHRFRQPGRIERGKDADLSPAKTRLLPEES
jgi:hypothetical protein